MIQYVDSQQGLVTGTNTTYGGISCLALGTFYKVFILGCDARYKEIVVISVTVIPSADEYNAGEWLFRWEAVERLLQVLDNTPASADALRSYEFFLGDVSNDARPDYNSAMGGFQLTPVITTGLSAKVTDELP